MKKYTLLYILTAMLCLSSCSSDDDDTPVAQDLSSNAHGTFTDERDGNTYNYVSIGGLDWTLENARYDTGSDDTRKVYTTEQIPGDYGITTDAETVAKYGYLYSFEGAQEAAPEGWRVPTDDDWKNLEENLGMSQSEADGDEWRGNGQAMTLLSANGLNMLLGGFSDENSTSYADKCYFIQAFAYYWTSTSPSDGIAYFRKMAYNRNDVYRHTTKTNNMLSVRFVRSSLYTNN